MKRRRKTRRISDTRWHRRRGSSMVVLFPTAFASTYAIFQRDHPHVEITVQEAGSLSIRKQMESGNLDIGIMINSNLPAQLESIRIDTGQILVCLPPGHALSELSSIPFNELRDEPFILFREDTYSRRMILEECAQFGFEPKVVFSSSQIATVLELVRRGVGLSFFIEKIVRNEDSITKRPLAEPLYLVSGLAWNRER